MDKIYVKIPCEYLNYACKLLEIDYNTGYFKNTGYFQFENKQFPEKIKFKVNGEPIYWSRTDIFNGEEFKIHPYLPILVSNYGRIKYKNTNEIIDQILYLDKYGSPYFYINIKFQIYDLIREAFSENKNNNTCFFTPIVVSKIESYSTFDDNDIVECKYHPYININVNKNGSIIYENNYAHLNKNLFIKFKENLDDISKYINIPFHVYRLVAETWLINEDYKNLTVVHHIVNNGFDNTVYNLIWTDKYQHDNLIHGK